MAESDVDELWVFAKFVVADHVEHFDAASDGGADEEFVAFGRELNALTHSLGFQCVKQPWWVRRYVEDNYAIMIPVQRGGHSHFTVRVKGKALRAIRNLFDHCIDNGFFQGQISDQNVGVVDAVSERSLAD